MPTITTSPPFTRQRLLHIVIAVLVTQLAALSAFVVTPELDGWFASLHRPAFAPPNWLFGPVWTVLYMLMGIAAGLVSAKRYERPVTRALWLYAVQLLVNAGWSLVFFGLHAPAFALVVIIALLALIVLTMRAFFPIVRTAGWLLVPYLAWVCFATALNAGYVVLN